MVRLTKFEVSISICFKIMVNHSRKYRDTISGYFLEKLTWRSEWVSEGVSEWVTDKVSYKEASLLKIKEYKIKKNMPDLMHHEKINNLKRKLKDVGLVYDLDMIQGARISIQIFRVKS